MEAKTQAAPPPPVAAPAAPPPADLFGKLGITRDKLSIQAEEISDEELAGPLNDDSFAGMQLLFGAVTRRKGEGGSYKEPLEIWHAVAQSPNGNWLFRSVRGRSSLRGKLRVQVMDAIGVKIAYLNTDTGELEYSPDGDNGRWLLVDRATSEPVFLAARVKLSRKEGKLAGQGQRYAYGVASTGLLQRDAKAMVKEIPLSSSFKLLTVDDAAPEGTTIEGETVQGKAKPGRKPKA